MADVKPAVKTTEFWATVVSVVGAVVVGVASVFDQLLQTGLIKDGSWVAVVATVVSSIAAALYSHQRSQVKIAALKDRRVASEAQRSKVNHV